MKIPATLLELVLDGAPRHDWAYLNAIAAAGLKRWSVGPEGTLVFATGGQRGTADAAFVQCYESDDTFIQYISLSGTGSPTLIGPGMGIHSAIGDGRPVAKFGIYNGASVGLAVYIFDVSDLRRFYGRQEPIARS